MELIPCIWAYISLRCFLVDVANDSPIVADVDQELHICNKLLFWSMNAGGKMRNGKGEERGQQGDAILYFLHMHRVTRLYVG